MLVYNNVCIADITGFIRLCRKGEIFAKAKWAGVPLPQRREKTSPGDAAEYPLKGRTP